MNLPQDEESNILSDSQLSSRRDLTIPNRVQPQKHYKAQKAVCVLYILLFIALGISLLVSKSQQEIIVSQEPVIPEQLTVHLVPHSHDDVGWLKTIDDYFYGGQKTIHRAAVQYVIDNVVTELTEHPQYKFVLVQMAFLYRWWNQASTTEKNKMKNLVKNKQLQFIGGGWSSSDEATVYYEDFIDNMAVGLRWLNETFNYVPDVAWQVDPFGHHASTASLFQRMGYNGIFFGRIDFQDKLNRKANKQLQMIWRPQQYSGIETHLFTHIDYHHYSPPPGFHFDAIYSQDPIIDDPQSPRFNLKDRSQNIVKYFKQQSLVYRSKNIMHTFGEDFTFSNARMNFKNSDKIIKYINTHPQLQIKIRYSTPDEYLAAVHAQKRVYPIKTDDFFPYSTKANSFWTGYFTSRVALKGFVRDFNRYVQAVRKHISQLKISGTSDTVKNNPKAIEETVFGMEAALGILQHHDAVSGTAKQKVTNDYVLTGINAINKFNKLYTDIKREEIQKEIGETVGVPDIYLNLYWNETGTFTGLSGWLNAGKTVTVGLYNPGSSGNYQIRLKVPPKDLGVTDQSNKNVPGDVICGNFKDTGDCDLLFRLQLPESGNAYVKLTPNPIGSAKQVPVKELTLVEQVKEFNLGDDKVRFTRGNQSFDLTLGGTTQTFKISYNYYESWDQSGQHSGAYIFRPKTNNAKTYSNIAKMHYADGATTGLIILEGDRTLTRVFFSKTPGVVRNYGFLVESQLDSIPVNDNVGKEVTLNLKTNLNNGKTFYTDSMGLQEQKRVLDYRPSWNYTVNEPTAGNYYPINAFIRLQDTTSNRSVTVLTDRSQGGSVLRSGEFEIMVHRRLLVDDSKGVRQPLNELDRDGSGLKQTVRHWVVFGNEYRTVQKRNDQRILPVFTLSNSSKFYDIKIGSPVIVMPSAVKLFLRPFQDGSYLLRLHNMNTHQKKPVQIPREWNLQQLALAANQPLKDAKSKSIIWQEQNQKLIQQQKQTTLFESIAQKLNSILPFKTQTVELEPFQIKTFALKIQKKH